MDRNVKNRKSAESKIEKSRDQQIENSRNQKKLEGESWENRFARSPTIERRLGTNPNENILGPKPLRTIEGSSRAGRRVARVGAAFPTCIDYA